MTQSDAQQTGNLKCTQCDTPSVSSYDGSPLCVDHFSKMMYAHHLLLSEIVANHNMLEGEMAAAYGGIIAPNYMHIPAPPALGGTYTLNNINVTGSNIGAINTGRIKNLDTAITLFEGRGDAQLASALKNMTEALINASDIDAQERGELAELLENLTAQAQVELGRRSGFVSTLFNRAAVIATNSASLVSAWQTLEPVLKSTLGL